MRKLYILSHLSASHAFEDYYDNLKIVFDPSFEITIVLYDNEKTIPLPQKNDEIYLFMNHVPPYFLNLIIDGLYRYIYLINTEQSSRPLWSTIMRYYTTTTVNLIDYDFYQTKVLQQFTPDREIFYLPYQVTEQETTHLKSLIENTKKIYNVAFCSTNQSERRLNIFTQLEQRGLTVTDVSGWKEQRDRKISQSQILVNIHYDDSYKIFEHMRCDRWILSGMLVVSEESLSDLSNDCQDLMIVVKYDQIVDKIVDIINNYELYYSKYLNNLSKQKTSLCENRHKYGSKLIDILQNS